MKTRKQRQFVNISGDTSQPLTVEVRPSYADDPLVLGPRYQHRDLKIDVANSLHFKTSGVLGRFLKL